MQKLDPKASTHSPPFKPQDLGTGRVCSSWLELIAEESEELLVKWLWAMLFAQTHKAVALLTRVVHSCCFRC